MIQGNIHICRDAPHYSFCWFCSHFTLAECFYFSEPTSLINIYWKLIIIFILYILFYVCMSCGGGGKEIVESIMFHHPSFLWRWAEECTPLSNSTYIQLASLVCRTWICLVLQINSAGYTCKCIALSGVQHSVPNAMCDKCIKVMWWLFCHLNSTSCFSVCMLCKWDLFLLIPFSCLWETFKNN